MTIENPIIAEVRKARSELLDAVNGNIEALLRDMMKRQHESGRQVVKLPTEKTQQDSLRNPYAPRL